MGLYNIPYRYPCQTDGTAVPAPRGGVTAEPPRRRARLPLGGLWAR